MFQITLAEPLQIFSKIVWLSGERTGFWANLRFRCMFATFPDLFHLVHRFISLHWIYQAGLSLQEKNFKVLNIFYLCLQHSIILPSTRHCISRGRVLWVLGVLVGFLEAKRPFMMQDTLATRHNMQISLIELVLKGGWVKIIHQFKLRPCLEHPNSQFVNDVTQFHRVRGSAVHALSGVASTRGWFWARVASTRGWFWPGSQG